MDVTMVQQYVNPNQNGQYLKGLPDVYIFSNSGICFSCGVAVMKKQGSKHVQRVSYEGYPHQKIWYLATANTTFNTMNLGQNFKKCHLTHLRVEHYQWQFTMIRSFYSRLYTLSRLFTHRTRYCWSFTGAQVSWPCEIRRDFVSRVKP